MRAERGATDTSNFKNAVDADDFFAPIASNANRILQGDIVKGDDGVFFRAIRDRTESAENFKASVLSGNSFVALNNANASGAWTTTAGKFKPDIYTRMEDFIRPMIKWLTLLWRKWFR